MGTLSCNLKLYIYVSNQQIAHFPITWITWTLTAVQCSDSLPCDVS